MTLDEIPELVTRLKKTFHVDCNVHFDHNRDLDDFSVSATSRRFYDETTASYAVRDFTVDEAYRCLREAVTDMLEDLEEHHSVS